MDQPNFIKIHSAVLHILDNSVQIPIISTKELEPSEDTFEFLEAHLSKVLNSDKVKNGVFNDKDSNIVYNLSKQILSTDVNFVSITRELANHLFDFMKIYPNIPPGDVIFSIFENENIKYMAIMKFNYKSSYIHYVLNTDEGTANNLIKQTTTLPSDKQKLEECIIINLSNFEIKLLEKEYDMNENKAFYLSTLFLKCSFDLSSNDQFKILNKVTKKINKKYYDENFEKTVKFNSVLAEIIKDPDKIEIETIAKEVFENQYDIQHEYIDLMQKEGLNDDNINIQHSKQITKKLETHKFKTDNGIEINLPSAYFYNKELIEFINNPDGTISILLKNINKITNK